MTNLLSPPVAQYSTAKTCKYAPMVSAAAAQVKRGKRVLAPHFRPCIFSHLGEISDGAFKTIEFIVLAYRGSLSHRYFEDGMKTSARTLEFRMRFKDALTLPPIQYILLSSGVTY